jgi:hypothetical protein
MATASKGIKPRNLTDRLPMGGRRSFHTVRVALIYFFVVIFAVPCYIDTSLTIHKIETSMAETPPDINEALLDVFNGTGRLYALIDAQRGKVKCDVARFTKVQLLDIAHQLNCWNANQAISDALHNAHHTQYIAPLRREIEQRNERFIQRASA